MPNSPSIEGSSTRERLPYRAPEIHAFGSIADITAGSAGSDYNSYGGHGGSPGPGLGMS